METKIKWIDGAKFIAILAVLVDHSREILYTNYRIAMSSYFSVTLFIFLSGMTMYYSDARHESETYFMSIIRGIKKIVTAYLLGTFIYQICVFRFFDFATYLKYLIGFNISGPLYFVLLYLQLMLVNKFLYKLSGGGIIGDIMISAVILFVSCITTNYTNILNVYGGGGKLLGGTYLLVFFLGMIIAKYDLLYWIRRKNNLAMCLLIGGLAISWWEFMCRDMFTLDRKMPFGSGVNPPGISLIIMAAIMLALSCSVFTFLEKADHKFINFCLTIVYGIGQCTLYIFIYHRLFLDYLLVPYIQFPNLWLKRCFYFMIMIIGPIFIKSVVILIEKYMNMALSRSFYANQNAKHDAI